MQLQFKDAATIDKIRKALAEREAKVLNAEISLYNARHIAEEALVIKIGQQLIKYIDSGMTVEQFICKTLRFCQNDRSDVKAIPIRADFTIDLVEGWGQEVSDD